MSLFLYGIFYMRICGGPVLSRQEVHIERHRSSDTKEYTKVIGIVADRTASLRRLNLLLFNVGFPV